MTGQVGERLAYESCSNCAHSNRPVGDEVAHAKFDWKKSGWCNWANVKTEEDGWCRTFTLHPGLVCGVQVAASQKAGTVLETLKSDEGGRQLDFESLDPEKK